jgi:hypothetical protein
MQFRRPEVYQWPIENFNLLSKYSWKSGSCSRADNTTPCCIKPDQPAEGSMLLAVLFGIPKIPWITCQTTLWLSIMLKIRSDVMKLSALQHSFVSRDTVSDAYNLGLGAPKFGAVKSRLSPLDCVCVCVSYAAEMLTQRSDHCSIDAHCEGMGNVCCLRWNFELWWPQVLSIR